MTRDCTAILILTYNTSNDTIQCIRSIEACNSAPVKYIVVDNGSRDKAEAEKLDDFFSRSGRSYRRWSESDTPEGELPHFSLLASQSNDGYARGNNKGLRLAFADPAVSQILVLNSDILFTEDMIPTLLDFQKKTSDCGLLTPLVVSRKGTVDHCCARRIPTNREIIRLFGYFNRDYHHRLSQAEKRQKILLNNPELTQQPSFPVDVPSGACMLIEKDLFRQIGGFDPDTFLYYEENILYQKLRVLSRTNYCVPSVRCTHLGAGSTQNQNSRFLQRCNLESADHYLSKYGKMTIPQRLAWFLVKGLWLLKFRITDTPKKS